MHRDGTAQTRLTYNAAFDGNLMFSSHGAKMVFESTRDGDPEIFVGTLPDLVPPVITLPGDMHQETANRSGVAVEYVVSAKDETDGTIDVLSWQQN